jgi:multidrug efflux system outer membrane protein
LFDWQSRFWSIGPSLTMPLFDAGLNAANLRGARAGYEQAVANYRQTVLAAFADVEDNLAAQALLASQSQAETAAVQAAHKQFRIADNRYRAGLVTFLDVATAENTALDIERTAVQLRGQQLVAAVSLVRSLGGGWQDPKARCSATADR